MLFTLQSLAYDTNHNFSKLEHALVLSAAISDKITRLFTYETIFSKVLQNQFLDEIKKFDLASSVIGL